MHYKYSHIFTTSQSTVAPINNLQTAMSTISPISCETFIIQKTYYPFCPLTGCEPEWRHLAQLSGLEV